MTSENIETNKYWTKNKNSDSKCHVKLKNNLYMVQWLLEHSKFNKNPLYIAGDSYSGILVPMVVLHISNGNLISLIAHFNFLIKGC